MAEDGMAVGSRKAEPTESQSDYIDCWFTQRRLVVSNVGDSTDP